MLQFLKNRKFLGLIVGTSLVMAIAISFPMPLEAKGKDKVEQQQHSKKNGNKSYGFWNSFEHKWNMWFTKGKGKNKSGVPEFTLGAAGGALLLLAGGTAVALGRRRRDDDDAK